VKTSATASIKKTAGEDDVTTTLVRKHDLKLRYGIPVTAELVAKDDDGWYPKATYSAVVGNI